MSKTFDLTTLNLSAGTHTITVKARAKGYTDSPASDTVSYVVAVQVSGTWYFNERLEQLNLPAIVSYAVRFTSNGVSYESISHDTGEIKFGSIWVAYFGRDNSWRNEAYRTITFDGVQTVSKEFYDWLDDNAERQTITLTIDFYSTKGETYDYTKTVTAYSGMTWREWVNSDYNIIGAAIDGDSVSVDTYDLCYGSYGNDVNVSDLIDENKNYVFISHEK